MPSPYSSKRATTLTYIASTKKNDSSHSTIGGSRILDRFVVDHVLALSLGMCAALLLIAVVTYKLAGSMGLH
jgi:hypothetical protein